jgi:hypothetical protein
VCPGEAARRSGTKAPPAARLDLASALSFSLQAIPQPLGLLLEPARAAAPATALEVPILKLVGVGLEVTAERVRRVGLQLSQPLLPPFLGPGAPSWRRRSGTIQHPRAGRQVVPERRVLDQPALRDPPADCVVVERQLRVDLLETAGLEGAPHPVALPELIVGQRQLDHVPVLVEGANRKVMDGKRKDGSHEQLKLGLLGVPGLGPANWPPDQPPPR